MERDGKLFDYPLDIENCDRLVPACVMTHEFKRADSFVPVNPERELFHNNEFAMRGKLSQKYVPVLKDNSTTLKHFQAKKIKARFPFRGQRAQSCCG